jgi:hypothetical protein
MSHEAKERRGHTTRNWRRDAGFVIRRRRLAGRAAHLDSHKRTPRVEQLIDGVHATDLRKNQVAGLPRKRELRAADS